MTKLKPILSALLAVSAMIPATGFASDQSWLPAYHGCVKELAQLPLLAAKVTNMSNLPPMPGADPEANAKYETAKDPWGAATGIIGKKGEKEGLWILTPNDAYFVEVPEFDLLQPDALGIFPPLQVFIRKLVVQDRDPIYLKLEALKGSKKAELSLIPTRLVKIKGEKAGESRIEVRPSTEVTDELQVQVKAAVIEAAQEISQLANRVTTSSAPVLIKKLNDCKEGLGFKVDSNVDNIKAEDKDLFEELQNAISKLRQKDGERIKKQGGLYT